MRSVGPCEKGRRPLPGHCGRTPRSKSNGQSRRPATLGLLSLGQVLWVLFLGTDVLRDAFTGLAADAHRPGYYFSRTKSSGTWHLAAMRVATEPSTADSSAPWPCEPKAIRSSLFFAAYAAI